MNRPKILGLALLAFLAVGAFSAAAAQAVPTEFHSAKEETFVFGEQEGENLFSTPSGRVKCKEATFDSLNAQKKEGGIAGNWTSKMWAVQPQRGNCIAFGAVAAIDNPPVETGAACDFYLFADTQTLATTGTPLPATGAGTAACEIKVTVPAGNCSLVINNQIPTTPNVAFKNVLFGGIGAIKATWAVEGISYTVEGAKGSICGEPGAHTDGKYEGIAVLRGYEKLPFIAVNQVKIWWE